MFTSTENLCSVMAAAALVNVLEHGYYKDQNGKRRKITGDFSKLFFAEHLSELQCKMLTDFRFGCKAILGT